MMIIVPANAKAARGRENHITITSPAHGSFTGIQVDVEGIFNRHIPHLDERWWLLEGFWLLTSPMDSNLTHPGAPIDFFYDRKWGGEWRGRHSVYLTGDPAQPTQPFKILVAKVTPETHALYVYRLQNEIYDYIEMQPGTIVYDHIIVNRVR